jgi:hypothetical protein
VRFDLRRGKAGLAFITDSASKGPNGLIVVDDKFIKRVANGAGEQEDAGAQLSCQSPLPPTGPLPPSRIIPRRDARCP